MRFAPQALLAMGALLSSQRSTIGALSGGIGTRSAEGPKKVADGGGAASSIEGERPVPGRPMIRFGLLGGRWGPFPWELFVTLGGSCLGGALLFVAITALWTPGRGLVLVEPLPLVVAGLVLLPVGFARRSRQKRTP
jgi:hypothetical protein